MYAVFRTGGKQYRAAKGDVLRLEKLDADEGATISFDEVLLLGEGADIKVGSPLLSGSSVTAKVLRQGKSRKVPVVKFRRRQNYLRQATHRQFFTEVEITGIGAKSSSKPAAEKADDSKPAASTAGKKTGKKAARKAAGKATPKKAAAKKAASKKSATKKKPAKKKAAKKKSTED